MNITAFLSRSPGLLNREPGSHSSILFPTDLNFLSPGLYNHFMPTQFKPSSVKVIPWHTRPDSPVIYKGAFLLLAAWPGRRSICNNHHHVVPLARISLTLSHYFSISFIASGRSLGLHPVSLNSCFMYVRAGRPAFDRPYAGIHWSA